jgi:hypothetical protein
MPINKEQFQVLASEIRSSIRKHYFHYKSIMRILTNVVNYSKHTILLYSYINCCVPRLTQADYT